MHKGLDLKGKKSITESQVYLAALIIVMQQLLTESIFKFVFLHLRWLTMFQQLNITINIVFTNYLVWAQLTRGIKEWPTHIFVNKYSVQ